MPGRDIPLVTNEIYHVFNKGIDERQTFTNKREFSRAILTIDYYRFKEQPYKLSHFLDKSVENKDEILENLHAKGKKLVDIIAYCLMPNHFHLLLKQLSGKGISKYLSNIQNSYTRYFNTRNERKGNLFFDQFKAVRVQNDDQLIHVSRYIHLNPYSSFLIKSISNLGGYEWSSFFEYMSDKKNKLCVDEQVMHNFKTRESYKKFVLDRADYQRRLESVKHLCLED